MSQSRRNNIIFYSILSLIVILSILGTFFAIKYHNKNVNKKEVTNNSKEEIIPYLSFKEVSASNTIDVFKEYPINPIKINHGSNNKITISGLKDKEIEKKVNEHLSILNDEKDREGNSLSYINFNMSNVLSITSDSKTINLNLVTGDEITIEEIFNKNTDIYSILVKSNYDNVCRWQGCYPNYDWLDDDYEWSSNVENKVIENLLNIKKNEYKMSINETYTILQYSDDSDGYNGTYIEYYDFSDDVTIFNRFLDDSIYENKVSKYCTIGSCNERINEREKSYFVDGYFLNDKVYLDIIIDNSTNIDQFYNTYSKNRANLNLKDFVKLFQEEILKKEGVNLKVNNYNNIRIYIDIYYHTENDYLVTYSLYNNEYKKEDFIKYRLGLNEAKTIREKSIHRINMLLDKNNKITYLSDNPTRDIPNFETKFYEYIMNRLKEEDNEFTGYNTCEFSEDDDCESKRDYHNLIKEASYAIDTVNNRLNIYEVKPGFAMAESYVNTSVSLDIFKDKPVEENNNDNQENTDNSNENNNDNVNQNENITNE